MITALVHFAIAIVTGLFFGAGVLLIKRIKPRQPDVTDLGAKEGDDRHFRNP